MDTALIIQIVIAGVTMGGIYALIALGLTIALNTSNVVNNLHGEFVVLGGLLGTVLYKGVGMPLLLAILLSIVAVTLVGAVVDRMLITPMMKKKAAPLLVIILTLGAANLFWSPEFLVWGSAPMNLPSFSSVEVIHFLGAGIKTQAFWVLGIAAAIMLLLNFFYYRTKLGQALLAVSINNEAASLMGINVTLMIMVAFAASGALGAIAGVLLTSVSYMRYDMGLGLLLKGFAGCVIGGMGSVKGTIVGGLILGLLESVGTGLVDAGYRDAIAFSIVILVLIFRPRGLFGSHLVGW